RMGDSLGMSGGSLAHSVEVCPVPAVRTSIATRASTLNRKPLTAATSFDNSHPLTFAPSDSQKLEVGDAADRPQAQNTSAGAGVRSSPGRSHPPVRARNLPTGSQEAASDQSRHRLSQPSRSRRGGQDPQPPRGRTGNPIRSRNQRARSFHL